jgi:hypothetical protein
VDLTVQNTVWFVIKYLIAFVAPQTQKQLQNKHNLRVWRFFGDVFKPKQMDKS